MTLTLSPQQDQAVLAIRDWYKNLPPKEYSHSIMVLDPDNGDYYEKPVYSRGFTSAPFFLLNGFAGTGKSTVLPKMVEAMGVDLNYIVFCAPTGKAAKVMTSKLSADGINKTANTIHKTIYTPKMLQAYQIESKLSELQNDYKTAIDTGDVNSIRSLKTEIAQTQKNLDRAYDDDSPQFHLNVEASAMMSADLVIVDECSMVDEDMADDLRSFGVPILAIGDPGQLPPINAPHGFCNREPDAALTEIHRQALDNPIIWASKLIREGEQVPMGSHSDGLLNVIYASEDEATFDMDRDAQIIVGTHMKRWQITRKCRKLCGFHKSEGPGIGELMIINKNSRLYPNLVNGTMCMMTTDSGKLENGRVTYTAQINSEDSQSYTLKCLQATIEEHYMGKYNASAPKRDIFRARQDDRCHELDFAYAITAHKSQGSQWDEVIVHDQSYVFKKDAKRWLYTAVTRASEKLTLVV